MGMWWPARDSPGEELLAEVAERYGLSHPITARRLTGGYANDVFVPALAASVLLGVGHFATPAADSRRGAEGAK
jgi:hypothetical protein